MGQAGVVPSDSPQMQLELQVVEGGVRLGEGDQSSSVLHTQRCWSRASMKRDCDDETGYS